MKRTASILSVLALAGMLGACNPTTEGSSSADTVPAATPSADGKPAAASVTHADWAGKWVGVEGMYVEITPTSEGTYTLTMQSDLDTLGSYTGTDTTDGIAFERAGQPLLLKAATGDQTGLKYLADKDDCLMVAEGEAYCRD